MNLPTRHPSYEKPAILWEALLDTTKHRNGNQHLPIPNAIGNCIFLNDVTYDEVQNTAQQMKEWCQ